MLRRTLLVLCTLPALAFAQQGGVTIADAWVRATVPGQNATGAYLEITSKEGATLVGVSSTSAGFSEVHEMSLEGGVMRMRPLPRLALPAGKTVALKPGGYHVMLMDLKQPLKAGDRVALSLKLEGPGGQPSVLEVNAEVRQPSGAPAATGGMSGMNHPGMEHMH